MVECTTLTRRKCGINIAADCYWLEDCHLRLTLWKQGGRLETCLKHLEPREKGQLDPSSCWALCQAKALKNLWHWLLTTECKHKGRMERIVISSSLCSLCSFFCFSDYCNVHHSVVIRKRYLYCWDTYILKKTWVSPPLLCKRRGGH